MLHPVASLRFYDVIGSHVTAPMCKLRVASLHLGVAAHSVRGLRVARGRFYHFVAAAYECSHVVLYVLMNAFCDGIRRYTGSDCWCCVLRGIAVPFHQTQFVRGLGSVLSGSPSRQPSVVVNRMPTNHGRDKL